MTAKLRAKGLVDEAVAFAKLKFPNFTHWRFSKLEDCTAVVRRACALISEHLELNDFQGCLNAEDWRTTFSTMRDRQWRLQLESMGSLSKTIGAIRVWGSGCSCHEAQLLQGEQVQCALKGRRIREASAHVTQQCLALRYFANNITLHSVGDDLSLQLELVTAYRMAAAAVQKRTEFLGTLPYLLSTHTQLGHSMFLVGRLRHHAIETCL